MCLHRTVVFGRTSSARRGAVRLHGARAQGARRAQLPAFTAVHTLSASRERITAAAFSARGDWLALGCAALGQLLVWEWRSERYVLRQQARPVMETIDAYPVSASSCALEWQQVLHLAAGSSV